MANSVYEINKGINREIEFKGLKAQYIAYLAGGLVFLMILFAVLYICGISLWITLPLTIGLATALFMTVIRLSHKYGRYGLMKLTAKKALPTFIRRRSRRTIRQLKNI